MFAKLYHVEALFLSALVFMSAYPPHIGAILFGLACVSVCALKFIDTLHAENSNETQAQIDKLKNDVERIVLRGRG